MTIESLRNSAMPGKLEKTANQAKPEKRSIIRDGFSKAKNAGKLAADKMKEGVRFIRTKSPTNKPVSTLFALATVGVGIGGLMTVGMTPMAPLAHLGLTLLATFGCSYVSHRFQ